MSCKALVLAALGSLTIGAVTARGEDAPKLSSEDSTPFFSMSAWTGSVELGVNGSEGNTRTLNGRAAASGQRETDMMLTKARISYKVARERSTTTENKAQLEVRNDWKLEKDSKWSIFALGTLEYDDFQDWYLRASAFGGVGYRFIDEKDTTLNGRVGLGASKKFGGADEDVVPEGLLGADFSHNLTERQKLTASVDLYPSLSNVGDYRAVTRAAWEVIVDPEVKMSLKVGVEDRYDSTAAAGTKRNDFDYFALLVWSF